LISFSVSVNFIELLQKENCNKWLVIMGKLRDNDPIKENQAQQKGLVHLVSSKFIIHHLSFMFNGPPKLEACWCPRRQMFGVVDDLILMGAEHAILNQASAPTTEVSAPTTEVSAPTTEVSAPTTEVSAPTTEVSAPAIELSAPAIELIY